MKFIPNLYVVLFSLNALPTFAQAVVAPLALPNPLPTMTRDDIRNCALTGDALAIRRATLKKEMGEHSTEVKALNEEADAINEAKTKLAITDEAAVAAFNARNEARNLRVDKLNSNAQRLNTAANDVNADGDGYLKQCSNRPFLISDKEAVMKALGKMPK